MAVHLFVLKGLARILTATGTAERTMRDRYAVRGFKAAEIPALHRAGEAAADGDTRHIDLLARHEMGSENFVAHFKETLLVHAELGNLTLGLDLGLREMTAFGACRAFRLLEARTELDRGIAVLF